MLCEDGGGEQYLRGLTTDGRIFDFAKNNVDLRQGTAGKNVSAATTAGTSGAAPPSADARTSGCS